MSNKRVSVYFDWALMFGFEIWKSPTSICLTLAFGPVSIHIHLTEKKWFKDCKNNVNGKQ